MNEFDYTYNWSQTDVNKWVGTMAPTQFPDATQTIGTISKPNAVESYTAMDVEMASVKIFPSLGAAMNHLEWHAVKQLSDWGAE